MNRESKNCIVVAHIAQMLFKIVVCQVFFGPPFKLNQCKILFNIWPPTNRCFQFLLTTKLGALLPLYFLCNNQYYCRSWAISNLYFYNIHYYFGTNMIFRFVTPDRLIKSLQLQSNVFELIVEAFEWTNLMNIIKTSQC